MLNIRSVIGKLPSMTAPRKLWALLTVRERWRLASLSGMIAGAGLAQVVGIGAIAPFVSVLIDPELVQTNRWLRGAFEAFGFNSTESFLGFLASGVLAAMVVANVLLGLIQWTLIRFSWDLQVRLSRHLLEVYLTQPYTEFLGRNSADTGKNILEEVAVLTGGIILPLLQMAAFAVSGAFILAALLLVNPALTTVMLVTLGGGYIFIYTLVRKRLSRAGELRITSNTERFKIVSESFGAIKETKVLGREYAFLDGYMGTARRFADAQVMYTIVSVIPGYAMQVLAVSMLLLLTVLLIGTMGRPLVEVAPLIAVYAFGAQRLLPSLQQVYSAGSQLQFNRVVVDTIYNDMIVDRSRLRPTPGATATPVTARLLFKHQIKLEGVVFQYPGASSPSSDGITLEVPHRAFVAFVGSTGAGKTTLADIILGLLQPQQGRLTVDGTTVDDTNVRAWQNNLGYVPQDVYLTDDTIAANIAFGIPVAQRDRAAIERAAVVANIHSFVTAELPHGYDTIVGERGIRLSGGERQRIGIARALYHQPDVLVLDEATSNLDQKTEAAVHQAIEQVAAAKTVIMIAHRLTTTWNCDTLYLLSHGRVIAQGGYGELLAESEQFQAMVGASGERK